MSEQLSSSASVTGAEFGKIVSDILTRRLTWVWDNSLHNVPSCCSRSSGPAHVFLSFAGIVGHVDNSG